MWESFYFSILIAGFGGGTVRALVESFKQFSCKTLKFETLYFFVMVFISGIVGLLTAIATKELGSIFFDLGEFTLALAFIVGYAGGDFLESIYKIVLKKTSIFEVLTVLQNKYSKIVFVLIILASSLMFANNTFAASMYASPANAETSSVGIVTLIGSGTSWISGTPCVPIFTLSGGTGASIVSQTVTDSTHATITINAGSANGTLVITDPSTNSTAPITVINPAYKNAVTAESSLSAYYRFDDSTGTTALVDSKNGHNADVSGTLTFGNLGLLRNVAGKSIVFDGGTGVAKTPLGVFDFERTQPWSIEFIIKPNITTNSTQHAIFSNIKTSSPFNGYEIQLLGHSSYSTVGLFMISNFENKNYINVYGTTHLANNTTYHIVVTYDGSSSANGVNFYINGRRETKAAPLRDTLSASILSPVSPAIGARQNTLFLPATLDELAVYNSVLSLPTINSHFLNAFNLSDPIEPTTPVPVILDTDLASDVDDVSDLTVLNYLANNNEANVLAVITDAGNNYSAPAAKAFLSYFGKSSVPVGAYQGATPTVSSSYTQTITNEFGTPGDTRTNYPDATTVYRQQLAAASDHSVVIVDTGYFETLKNLLLSPADSISSLTGVQLVAAKVKRLVAVAGYFPDSAGTAEYNFLLDPVGANYVFGNWPTEIVSVGCELGSSIYAGPLLTDDPTINPIKRAFNLWNASQHALVNGKRPAWGTLGLLYGVRGLSTNFEILGSLGTTEVNSSNGNNLWSQYPYGSHYYLGKAVSDSTFESILSSFFVDTNPPTISISTPSNVTIVHGNSTAVTAIASDNTAVTNVQFKLDGSNLGSAITSSPYTLDWDTTAVSDGTHSITAVATDAVGNSKNSATINVTVDNAGPINVEVFSITPTSSSQLIITAQTAIDSVSGLAAAPYYFDRNNGVANSDWQISTIFADAGLSSNTQYNYKVKAKDATDNISNYSPIVSKYTLADIPTNFSAFLNSNNITLAVDSFPNATSGSSGYYFSRSGADSGWIQTNSWQDTNLPCGTSYTYSVKYRNAEGVETIPISLTKSTAACGIGFITPPKPTVTPTDPTLGTVPSNITQIAISRTPDFTNISWQPFDKDKFKSIDQTTETLYVKFRTDQGAVSDVITYAPQVADQNAVITLNDGDIVKTPNNPDVYVIKYKNNKQYKRLILSPLVFKSYGHLKWENIKIVSQEQLDQYTTSSLVKETTDTVIYQLFPNGDTGERKAQDTSTNYDPDSVYEINKVDRDSYKLVK